MAELKQFQLEVISPERVFYTGDVEMVELTTTEGDIGILAGHIPLTTIVAPGVLTISEPDNVTDEIDVDRAKEARDRAERRLKSSDENVNMARAELALRKSLVRIELAEGNKK